MITTDDEKDKVSNVRPTTTEMVPGVADPGFVYPGSDFFPIPDPNFSPSRIRFFFPSRIRIFAIPDPNFFLSRI